jgi:exodeoxyribonuclease V alpha subunit
VTVETRFDASAASGSDGTLGLFNAAGLLAPSDVHVAVRLSELAGLHDDALRLGVAFAVRAPRLGHVCVDLESVRRTASSETDAEVDVGALPWPDAPAWVRVMADSPVVGTDRPLHLNGAQLYLNRLWVDECLVASDLTARARNPVPDVHDGVLAEGLARLFRVDADPDHLQPIAAAAAVRSAVSVIAGGPGTGKTTTVARVLALLGEQARATGLPPPRCVLAAPTGKAGARLEEAVRSEAIDLPIEDVTRARLLDLRGTTIHRLLGFNPANRTRFRHSRENPLPYDVIVVDETSMVALSLMARLLEAIHPDARIVLVGDPEQLASVEAGAVLGDIVGPASHGLCMGETMRARIGEDTGYEPVSPRATLPHSVIGDGIVVLRYVHRHGGAIAAMARAVQRGDADAAIEVLTEKGTNVQWIDLEAGNVAMTEGWDAIERGAVESGRAVIEAASSGNAAEALLALNGFRLICAHRRGAEGVEGWTRQMENWLLQKVDGFSPGSGWYVGQPLIITENDYSLGLYNGDIGVVVSDRDDRMVAAFERAGEVVTVSPTRLAAVDTVYAMTVHKSQGSQFHTVVFMVPAEGSRLLTRELLYTAVTRAQEHLILVGSEGSIRAAIDRPIARASGLRQALWGSTAHDADPAERGI